MDELLTPEVLNGVSYKDMVRMLYLDDQGKPFELTHTQEEIFRCIFAKQSDDGKRRLHIETYTQFGKSETISMAVLTRVSFFPEKWVILAPSFAKARIIMSAIIKHALENSFTRSRLMLNEGESIDRLRMERSKNRLTFNIGPGKLGEVFILSTESRIKNEEDIGNALMGFGAPNIVMDEASLLDDGIEAKAVRMVGGFTSLKLDFIAKIGNPFRRNHFFKSRHDPKYHKILADYKVGVAEGRLTEEFINEMRPKPFFSILYECKFPDETEVDQKGWSQLISEEEIERAFTAEKTPHLGFRKLGLDVARGGGNHTSWCMRSLNSAEFISRSESDNLMDHAARTLLLVEEHKIPKYNIFVDSVAIGAGVVDKLMSEDLPVNAVNVGVPALDEEKFFNLRAEAYWRARDWIKRGGKLSRDDGWFQMARIKWKPDSKGRLKIMSKEEMRSMGIDSPDDADAFMLTFTRPDISESLLVQQRKQEEMDKQGSFDPHAIL